MAAKAITAESGDDLNAAQVMVSYGMFAFPQQLQFCPVVPKLQAADGIASRGQHIRHHSFYVPC